MKSKAGMQRARRRSSSTRRTAISAVVQSRRAGARREMIGCRARRREYSCVAWSRRTCDDTGLITRGSGVTRVIGARGRSSVVRPFWGEGGHTGPESKMLCCVQWSNYIMSDKSATNIANHEVIVYVRKCRFSRISAVG